MGACSPVWPNPWRPLLAVRKECVIRTVIVCNIMSLDAYYEGPGRNVMALNMDEA